MSGYGWFTPSAPQISAGKTVILINPFNIDVTSLMPAMLQGTVLTPGDTLQTLRYTNQPGVSNIETGAQILNAALTKTAGPVVVFGYAEGAQVAYRWLREYGTTAPVSPTRVSFVLVGNAERRYGGIFYQQSGFGQIVDTLGLPATVPYRVVDFARQYDGFADAPAAAVITAAVASTGPAISDLDNLPAALTALAMAATDPGEALTLENMAAGMTLTHADYFEVTLADRANVSYVDPATPTVTYVWSPTYPVPVLGLTHPGSDLAQRDVIETFYGRPVTITSSQTSTF